MTTRDETHTVHDPYLNKDVQVSNKLTDRLRGRYACGPIMPNGEPEFGWREFETPPIQKEAASAIDAKDAKIARLKAAHFEADDKRCYWQSRADTAESRISDLERQLAEETERCARVAEDHESTADDRSFDGNIQWHEGNDNACHRIAAAIRGGVK
jgi:hypothetical protein